MILSRTWNDGLVGLLLLAFAGWLTACGREWVPDEAGECVFDADCIPGRVCFNGRCILIDYGEADGGVRLKEFGEPCESNEECISTYCLPHTEGGFCTQPCEDGCPPSWSCKRVLDPHGGANRLGLCAMQHNRLCQSCESDTDCHAAGADLCLQIGDGTYCSADCWYSACPTGYRCSDVEYGGQVLRQCLPLGQVCSCTEETAGMVRGCERSNELGTCTGYEQCDPLSGWTDCSARVPAAEMCNGIDDDCNGLIDEDLVGGECVEQNQYGVCRGVYECHGFDGWVCGAPTPRQEACDNTDNDCDGEVDEGFTDGMGRYVTDEHCGGCEINCDVMIAHSTETECRLENGEPVCRALACEPGFFVWQGGVACLSLPANLCQPCNTDADCLAPGSICIINGSEQYCGRDCSPSSPYGPGCPEGYVCAEYQAWLQCQPETDTCLCSEENQGTVRSCLVDVCVGYQECLRNGTRFEWSECNIEDFNVEICDGLDNNCNGQIDEGFLNQQTGRYESDEHCGFCNNDCSDYWSEPIDHTTGVCDVDLPGMPGCVMGPCSTESEGGAQYEWVDVNGLPGDGCECRRVLGNTGNDLPDLIGEPEPGLAYLDENCDGIDGVIGDALFVSASASAGGDGSLAHPFTTITRALEEFAASGKDYILVAEGTYTESIELVPGARLHGGYAVDFQSRDVWLYQSVISAQVPEYAVLARDLVGSGTILSGFVVKGRHLKQAAPVDSDGQPSVAVAIHDCDDSLVLRSNVLVGGDGADGGPGSSGEAGFGRQDSTLLDGASGLNGMRSYGTCSNDQRPGGSGGTNPQCATDGQPGGTTVCPQFDWDAYPYQGAQAQYISQAGGNGPGGFDWSFDWMSGSGCSHATESGYPTEIQLNVGQDGADGTDGNNGQGGQGGTGSYGSFSGSAWVPAPDSAAAGTAGGEGSGGGGGGGGGGTARYNENAGDCGMYEIGPSGGGGGAGGCGGQGGKPGRVGGASIVVLVTGSASSGGQVELRHNLIERGIGGRGGDGGYGGIGGLGGIGGFGGEPPDWISSLGGKGGDGGNGGPGGGGGGGVGGPSYGILAVGIDVSGFVADNSFIYDDDVPTGGLGGAGGVSVGPGATGSDGADGSYRNLLGLTSCTAGNCPAGQHCDANDICIPDN